MSQPEADDELEALLFRCARHDHKAFEELYKRVSSVLLGILLRMLRARDVAEDALQEVFVRIWLRAGKFEAHRGRALAWMTSIARYHAIDIQRGRRTMVDLGFVAERSVAPAGLESASTRRSLERCLGLLSGDQRHCLVLAYQQGLTQDDIASSLGHPLGTVKSWLRRSLSSLRRCLES